MSGVLYVSYDGMLEPLGQSQVLAYLERLASGRNIYLISFEKAEDLNKFGLRAKVHARMNAAGIRWYPRRYHKSLSAIATSWDICVGITCGMWMVLRYGLQVVHARSYVPGVIALVITRLTGVKFLFDMRGFWADERVDGGLWPANGRMYRIAKCFERWFLQNANHVVSLTNAAAHEMRRFPYLEDRIPPITVIPTCADLTRFRPVEDRDPRGKFVLGYVGSAGTWYLFDSVAACFRQLLDMRPEARLLVVNRNEHDYIRERLVAAEVPSESFDIRVSDHADIHGELAKMDAGVFFYKPSYSRTACSPTKLGEFLGCGLPCLSNSGVGDMTEVLEGEGVGVTIIAFDDDALRVGLTRLLDLVDTPGIAIRCAEIAKKYFALEQGVERYNEIYDSLASDVVFRAG